MQDLLFNSSQDLRLIHEILRQSLQLPFAHQAVMRVALGVLRTWLFTNKERRPIFLQGPPTHRPTMELLEVCPEIVGPDGVLDYYLQEYIDMVACLFRLPGEEGEDAGDGGEGQVEERVEMYREGLYFLRALGMKVFFPLSRAAWARLLECVLSLVEQYLGPPKCRFIPHPALCEPFVALLMETLFGLWLRSETLSLAQWERLGAACSRATEWAEVVEEWARIALILTDVMAETMFPAANKLAAGDEANPATAAAPLGARRRHVRMGTFEGTSAVLGRGESSHVGRVMLWELGGGPPPPPPPLTGSAGTSGTTSPMAPIGAATGGADGFASWRDSVWVRENILFLWRQVLGILGNVNSIGKAAIHEIAIGCLARMAETLVALRNAQPYFVQTLPPIYELADVLLDACDLPSRAFENSRCLAYSVLCRIFCQRLDVRLPQDLLTRFYLAILNGLSDKDDPVASIIILSASRIFSRTLPGATILTSSLYKCFAGILNSVVPLERSYLLVPMMRLIGNAAVVASTTPQVTIPRIEVPLPIMNSIPITAAGAIDIIDIKHQTKNFLVMMDQQDSVRGEPAIHSVLLSVAASMLLAELMAAAQDASQSLIDGYFAMLLDHLPPRHGGSPALTMIFEAFRALAQLYPLYERVLLVSTTGDKRSLLLERLMAAIRSAAMVAPGAEAPGGGGGSADETAARLVEVLLEWLLVLPTSFLLGEQLGLYEQAVSLLNEVALTEPSAAAEAAHLATLYLMQHFANFAPELGATIVSSQVPDPAFPCPDRTCLYFALNNSAILTVHQLCTSSSASSTGQDGGADTSMSPPQVRIIVRNAVGRQVWDSCMFYETPLHWESPLFVGKPRNEWRHYGMARDFVTRSQQVLAGDEESSTLCHYQSKSAIPDRYQREWREIPRFDATQIDLERVDMLENLLEYIGEEHPECCPAADHQARGMAAVHPPTGVPEWDAEIVERVAQSCQRISEQSQTICRPYASFERDHVKAQPRGHDPTTTADVLLPPFHHCRQLLASLGLLLPPTMSGGGGEAQGMPLKVLSQSGGLLRDLKGLDKKPPRETIKVALVYVGPGQEEELSILANDLNSVSPDYLQFREALAVRVDLGRHYAYNGGLEPGVTADNEALYYCSSLVEVVFHEAVTLLCDPLDTTLLAKRRHIGNDHVQIVWNEHHRDFRPNPRGDYGNVFIIITPLPALQLYSISVHRDAQVPVFGPLFDGALVPRALLGPLIRTTTIAAHRAVLASMGRRPPHPVSLRAQDIALIIERHTCGDWDSARFLQFVMFGGDPPIGESGSRTALHPSPQASVDRLAERTAHLQVEDFGGAQSRLENTDSDDQGPAMDVADGSATFPQIDGH